MFPLTAALRAALETQVKATEALEKDTKQTIPWLFHRHGKPIKSRRAWLTALLQAGHAEVVSQQPLKIKPLRIPHDPPDSHPQP